VNYWGVETWGGLGSCFRGNSRGEGGGRREATGNTAKNKLMEKFLGLSGNNGTYQQRQHVRASYRLVAYWLLVRTYQESWSVHEVPSARKTWCQIDAEGRGFYHLG